MIDYDKLKDIYEKKYGLAYFNGSRSELVTLCPYCEMKSTKTHGHLYIEVEHDDNIMPTFYCQKCNMDQGKGILLKLLKYTNVDPTEIMSSDLISGFKFKRGYVNKSGKIKEYILPTVDRSGFYETKYNYVKNRLGVNYNIESIPNLVLDIRTFVTENNVELDDRSKQLFDYICQNFVGFISARGTVLICRNCDPSSEFRYYKLQLTNVKSIFKDLYVYHTNITKAKTNMIVLCEGIFDLLYAVNYSELLDLRNSSCIWGAVLGNHYDKCVASMLDFCKLTIANVTILSDRDFIEDNYKYVNWNPSVNNLDVYYNKVGKDWGEPPIIPCKKRFNLDRRFSGNGGYAKNTENYQSNSFGRKCHWR